MSTCTSGCPTKDHESYAECLQSKSVQPNIVDVKFASTTYRSSKLWETEIKEYRAARAQGIAPKSSSLKDIRSAVVRSAKADAPVKEA